MVTDECAASAFGARSEPAGRIYEIQVECSRSTREDIFEASQH